MSVTSVDMFGDGVQGRKSSVLSKSLGPTSSSSCSIGALHCLCVTWDDVSVLNCCMLFLRRRIGVIDGFSYIYEVVF